MVKRLFDGLVSLAGLIVLFPPFVAIAVLIKADSRGPVFYRGARVGHFGKPFRIFKLRTMVGNADKLGGPSTAGDDPRITRVGKFLRRYKLDELPQLINVARGEMSLVGPRPEVPQYVAMLSKEERAVLSARPGITDWASIWNPDEGAILAGSPDPEKVYLEKIRPEKIRLQLEYVRNRSFRTDLAILAQTARVLVLRNRPIQKTDAVCVGDHK